MRRFGFESQRLHMFAILIDGKNELLELIDDENWELHDLIISNDKWYYILDIEKLSENTVRYKVEKIERERK